MGFLYYNLSPLFDKDKHKKPSTLLSQVTDNNIIYGKENNTINTTNIDSISQHKSYVCITKHNNDNCISIIGNKSIRVSRNRLIRNDIGKTSSIIVNISIRVSRNRRIRNDICKTSSVLDLFTFFLYLNHIFQKFIIYLYLLLFFIIIIIYQSNINLYFYTSF